MNLESERIILRQWRNTDLEVFAQINADSETMQHFPSVLTRTESNRLAESLRTHINENGWGFWAAEIKKTGEFIGFVGLNSPLTRFSFSPCVEIGWRLHKDFWGYGYATEAGKATLQFAFEQLHLKQVVSFTIVANKKSRAVMERLGLVNTDQNFIYPGSPPDQLVECVLYTINNPST